MIKDLFRGKCKETGEWQYGDKVTEINGSTIKTFIHNRISPINFNGDSLTSGLVLYEVVPETVGQYINKKDAAGKEIYEGDYEVDRLGVHFIAKYEDGELGMVVWEPGYEAYFDDCVSWDDFTICGNRFDNPDLKVVSA
ncbi:YopX protein [compost metagenome]